MANNHFADPDAELTPLLAARPPPPASFTSDIPNRRIWFEEFFAAALREVQAPSLPTDGGTFVVRSYYPTGYETGGFPLFFWMHGGGFIYGSVETDDYLCRILCDEFKLAVLNVDYRPCPEHPFPGPWDDSYAALKWAVANAPSLHFDLQRGIIIAGLSAGSILTAALTHRARGDAFFAEHGTRIVGQLMQAPTLCHPDSIPEEYKEVCTSFAQNADAPLLSMRQVEEYRVCQKGQPFDPDYSPLLHPSFEGLPAAYMQVCGMDPFRDTALVYADRLRAAGVPVKVEVYRGAPHAFHYAYPKPRLGQKFDKDMREGLKWLLERARAH
ncbi:Alpha/Beta hydrolase protein [Epithele typhae]|uniref:Alpha/Beta hydrolase protein n=1 Tax=Epithele typhae TaxID=378194 RepID=UPI00200817BD|nr:Alpha/Beta hydrolase protein [Epithele typhae]KAH9935177.1 Alpha/Beta hydrolase protein [Epithele typhae]